MYITGIWYDILCIIDYIDYGYISTTIRILIIYKYIQWFNPFLRSPATRGLRFFRRMVEAVEAPEPVDIFREAGARDARDGAA